MYIAMVKKYLGVYLCKNMRWRDIFYLKERVGWTGKELERPALEYGDSKGTKIMTDDLGYFNRFPI